MTPDAPAPREAQPERTTPRLTLDEALAWCEATAREDAEFYATLANDAKAKSEARQAMRQDRLAKAELIAQHRRSLASPPTPDDMQRLMAFMQSEISERFGINFEKPGDWAIRVIRELCAAPQAVGAVTDADVARATRKFYLVPDGADVPEPLVSDPVIRQQVRVMLEDFVSRRAVGEEAPSPLTNQCDGCRRGLVLKDGLHYDHTEIGLPVIGCTAHLYASSRSRPAGTREHSEGSNG